MSLEEEVNKKWWQLYGEKKKKFQITSGATKYCKRINKSTIYMLGNCI
jgi:ribosomal protein L7Ae-like RNA K-turn-binding protein